MVFKCKHPYFADTRAQLSFMVSQLPRTTRKIFCVTLSFSTTLCCLLNTVGFPQLCLDYHPAGLVSNVIVSHFSKNFTSPS